MASPESYQENLYDEMRDMAVLAFFVYDFAFIIDAARKTKADGKGEFVGLEIDLESEKPISKSTIDDTVLSRSFTPKEVKDLIEKNIDHLADYDSTFKGKDLEEIYAILDRMIAIEEESGMDRPLTVEEFDDKHQTHECVYGIVKDDVKKRINIVFRGTENKLAFGSNWKSNASIFRKKVDVPESLKGKLSKDTWKFHSGFHNYLFGRKSEEIEHTKYDQILGDVRSLLTKFPGYHVYTTGHSLGAALSTICSIYLACEQDLPKPISCINFASPRMGSRDVFNATMHLEKTQQIRILRSVNENDSVTTIPSQGYDHVGVQVTAYAPGWFGRQKPPSITYRNPNHPWYTRWGMAWSNNFVTNLNLGYDHGGYIDRIDNAKEELEQKNLAALYADEDFVGYKLQELQD